MYPANAILVCRSIVLYFSSNRKRKWCPINFFFRIGVLCLFWRFSGSPPDFSEESDADSMKTADREPWLHLHQGGGLTVLKENSPKPSSHPPRASLFRQRALTRRTTAPGPLPATRSRPCSAARWTPSSSPAASFHSQAFRQPAASPASPPIWAGDLQASAGRWTAWFITQRRPHRRAPAQGI